MSRNARLSQLKTIRDAYLENIRPAPVEADGRNLWVPQEKAPSVDCESMEQSMSLAN